MEPVIFASPPPTPLGEEVVITLLMVALASFLSVSGRTGRWKPKVLMIAASLAVIIVISLEFSSGHNVGGLFAALIGLVSGVACSPWLIQHDGSKLIQHRGNSKLGRWIPWMFIFCGPIAGVVYWFAMVFLFHSNSHSRAADVTEFLAMSIFFGMIAGCMAALVFGIILYLRYRSGG